MKKGRMILLITCSLLITVAIVMWVFNYQFLLLSKGFSLDSNAVVTQGEDASGEEFRIMGNSEEGKHSALAVAKKGFLGIWSFEQFVDERQPDTRQLVVSTLNAVPDYSNPKTAWESIFVFAGDNAIRDLTDISDLPELKGSTVKVSQNDRWYTVCITWQGRELSGSTVSLYGIMKEHGFVE